MAQLPSWVAAIACGLPGRVKSETGMPDSESSLFVVGKNLMHVFFAVTVMVCVLVKVGYRSTVALHRF